MLAIRIMEKGRNFVDCRFLSPHQREEWLKPGLKQKLPTLKAVASVENKVYTKPNQAQPSALNSALKLVS